LRARETTGRGQFCETSLLQASMAFQAGEFVFYDARPDFENSDPERRGASALSRAYRCSDGEWLFVSVENRDQFAAMRSVLGVLSDAEFDDICRAPADGAVSGEIARGFGTRTRAEVIAMLERAHVPVAPVNHLADLMDDPQVLANNLVAELNHSEWGRVRQTGELIKFSRTRAKIENAAPILGEHTDSILREYLGYDDTRIADLRASRIVR
jgi:crotonobetainyl-CoA:carnitine CoA-transferase CaiB-like acyl-CoA transferase